MNFEQTVLKAVREHVIYFSGYSTFRGYYIVGSFMQCKRCIFMEPKDIDVIIVTNEKEEIGEKEYSFFIEEADNIEVNVTVLTPVENLNSIIRLEPKYFDSFCSSKSLEWDIDGIRNISNSEIRSKVMKFSDLAFNKGKKKLTIEKDYDEELGLKNICHAYRFLIDAIRFYYPSTHLLEKEMMDLGYSKYRHRVYKIYKNTQGTLDDKYQAMVKYAKPEYNRMCSEFRKLFPR